MKLLARILCSFALVCGSQSLFAQCTTASLNWDALEYLPTTGYSNAQAIALSPNQKFAFGKNTLTVAYSSGITSVGETTNHTGETNAFGIGADVQYVGTGTITLTFTTEVTGVKFSVFDIDDDERLTISATNSLGSPSITITPLAAAHNMTITGSPGTAPVIQDVKYTSGGQTGAGTGVNTSSINVDIATDVKTITLTYSSLNNNKDFWLSDISACITSASFPGNTYYNVSRPFNGTNGLPSQPSYILEAINKSVYMVNPVTGVAKFIFSDGATSGTINSLAYDPYNHVIYYCWSLTNNGSANASERTLRKYDMTTGTATTLLADVTSLGIPTFDQGVESGAAAFYDGALYLGIEGGVERVGNNPKTSTNKESIIWRLDFTNGIPTAATEVFGVSGDTHDWSDFSISNGILYDFNGDAGNEDYHHLNLQTGANLLVPYVTTTPKQTTIGWDGTVYFVGSTIGVYNGAGGVGTQVAVTSTPAIPNWSNTSAPSFGDAAEAFRPRMDFGDAPATYDPDPLAPAVHELNSNLRIGSNESVQWDKPTTASLGTLANTDTYDDGLSFVRILVSSGNNYQTNVNVFNNTGANATLAGWIDFNNDGVFQSTEGIVQTVASSNTTQSISLYWTGISTVLPLNSYTYLRMRITSATSGMTAANATGWFPDGEVEDYYLPVNSLVLTANVLNFSAKKQTNNQVDLTWSGAGQEPGTIYEVQRSSDSRTWTTLYKTAANATANVAYSFTDMKPTQPASHYRLQYGTGSGSVRYSNTEKITFSTPYAVQVYPNPAVDQINLLFSAPQRDVAVISLQDFSGRIVYTTRRNMEQGWNQWQLSCPASLATGIYTLTITLSDTIHTKKLVIRKP